MKHSQLKYMDICIVRTVEKDLLKGASSSLILFIAACFTLSLSMSVASLDTFLISWTEMKPFTTFMSDKMKSSGTETSFANFVCICVISEKVFSCEELQKRR